MEENTHKKKSKLREELREQRRGRCAKHKDEYLERFKWWDSYGEPISLTYKGEESYKTIPGAIISYIVTIILILYAVQQGYLFITRGAPTVTMTVNYLNLNKTQPIRPIDYGFDFAIGLSGYSIPPSIGSFIVQ